MKTPAEAAEIRRKAYDLRLDASLAYWQLPDAALAELTGGCGPGEAGDGLVPDYIFGMVLTPACQIHDFDYSALSDVTKPLADARFLANMVRIMDGTNPSLLTRIRQRWCIIQYWRAVDALGGAFQGGKQ